MPKRECGDWIKEYMDYTAHLESPTKFHFWTAVSTIAGALRRQVWIPQFNYDWTPNFYIILVGPPGVAAKSTSISVGRRLLDQVPGVTIGPSSLSWQSLVDAFNDATYGITDPSTGESYGISPLTCNISELGTFLKTNDRDFVQFLTDIWDSPLNWKRRLRAEGEINIPAPWLNVIGATTPSWLADNYPERLIKEGLTSRIVFAYGDKKRHHQAYLDDAVDVKKLKAQQLKLADDLCQMAQLIGPMELAPDARAWGVKWYEDLWTNRPLNLTSDRFDGYIARKQTMIHKLAIVLQLATGDNMVVSLENLQKAEQIITAQEDDMQIIFESLGVVPQRVHMLLVLQTIKIAPDKTISRREAWQILNTRMRLTDFNAALEACKEAGYISITVGVYGVMLQYIYKPPAKEQEQTAC